MTKSDISKTADEQTSKTASEHVKTQETDKHVGQTQNQLKGSDVRDEEALRAQMEYEQQMEEEENQKNARLALLELETQGRQYFKPKYETTYVLAFNRKQAFLVRGVNSQKLTKKVQDRFDKNITHEVPAIEYVHTVVHENGDEQTWSITSRELHKKIINKLMEGYSRIAFRKRKTGERQVDVDYDVEGVGSKVNGGS